MKKLYRITLRGCDDKTTIERWLSEDEILFLKELEISFNETSTYSCMPMLGLEEVTEDETV